MIIQYEPVLKYKEFYDNNEMVRIYKEFYINSIWKGRS